MKKVFTLAFLLVVLVCGAAAQTVQHSNTLKWVPSISDYTANNVYMYAGSCTDANKTFVKIGVVAAPTAGYVDSVGLVEGQARCYVVRAFNNASSLESGDSNTANAVTPFSSPLPPSNLTVDSK